MRKEIEPKDVVEYFTFYRRENDGKEPTEWSQVTMFNKLGYGVIAIDGNCGAIDQDGKIIIPLIYSNLIDFAELESTHILACDNNDLWGYINWENEILITFEYSYASVFQEGLATVCKDGKYYIINTTNEIIEQVDFLTQPTSKY